MLNRSLLRCSSLAGFALLAASLAPADDFRVSGPYTHENLSIYLLHGAGKPVGTKLLTLQEAMDQQAVTVYETGQVNQLAIENRSSEDVFIQSGDIVKGGRQDRVLTTDVVLPAHSGKLPIGSFCVEHGRWTQRGDESPRQFSTSNAALPTKSLKLAVRDEKDQAKVWQEVAHAQTKLADASGVPAGTAGGAVGGIMGGVIASPSPTSMQLALENRKVAEATDAYVRSLVKVIDGKNDVVGYAYAINGKVNSAEVYASTDLFRRMWPKMLASSAAEALAERPNAKASAPPAVAAVQDTLTAGDRGRETSKDSTGRLSVVKKESAQVILFEASDQESGGKWIHKSYVVK